ncbi:MAG: AraC family ligand binding domain-containing protein [Muricoprocola sp.]
MGTLEDSKFDVLQHKQINGMRIYLNTLDYRTPHFHKEIEIMLILDGDLDIQSETYHCVAKKGDIILCNSREAHELKKVTKSCTLIGYHIAPALVDNEFPEFD